jgi:transposase
LLIHCARAALRTAATSDKPDRLLQWALQVQKRRDAKVAVEALANKLARVACSLLTNGGQYQPAPQKTAPVPG